MKNEPPLKIASPCPKQWEGMTGDAKRRYCEHCKLHVHNLSAMSKREQRKFVAEGGDRACVTYLVRPDGSMISERFWHRLFKPFRFAGATVLATLLPFWFSACASRRIPLTGSVCPTPQRLAGAPMPVSETQEAHPGKKVESPVTRSDKH
ncbi:MAG TPA: hypothetical protein VHM91_21425 [Verrucomicrobiales bacterium]|nr:hypothetical protein [Verrucomicrobiales bacterium]